MSDEWMDRRISLRNKHGLHMRPAQKIVETATGFQAEIRAIKDDLDFSAKSILDMIEFAAYMVNRASENDNEFTFRAKGPDAREALEALDLLVANRFGLE
ncbi:MAG: HPr family phosphocarrier protein [Planctomycetota bacterium]|nr:HPr family phosphocarrier protein [Planctomycetota bacterium]